jgi:hypothetical protein
MERENLTPNPSDFPRGSPNGDGVPEGHRDDIPEEHRDGVLREDPHPTRAETGLELVDLSAFEQSISQANL